jgi:serine phosphatase RsbU (regulator of sigma subunit)
MTDAALSQLGPDELMSELLRRLCDLLPADTACVLLYDAHARQLVATAAVGVEEEVRLGIRVALGRGFAGRVAAQRAVLSLDNVRQADIASAVLRARAPRALLGVPMLAGGELVGVLEVGSLQRRSFTPDDIHLAQLAADRAAMAAQQRLSRIDREAALALQRGLLPTRLPAVSGLELSARYVPGHDTGVGGDWYDVFRLPDDCLGVVVGDVSGHGLGAAVVMGRLRSALRAYALECADPAEALTRLDRKIHHFETGNLATALYAMVTPDRTSITVSVAGHPPPLLARPGEPTRVLDVPADLPLGTGSHKPLRRNTTLELPDESLLVCYTDGLVERRRQPIREGLARLLDAVRPESADAACATIMAAMNTEDASDDIAILTMRRTVPDL